MVAMDLSGVFTPSQAYVMLSRVEDIKQLVIMERIKEKAFRIDEAAKAELELMNARSINANPSAWRREGERMTKIAALNVMNLRNNWKYASQDPTLLLADLICFSETWVEEDAEESDFMIDSYKASFNSAGNGKGIVGYFKPDVFSHSADCKLGAAQLSLFKSEAVDVIHIYRSQQQQLSEIVEKVREWWREDKVVVVCGDLNVCLKKKPENSFSQGMESLGLSQIGKEATHVLGGQIDHFYVTSEAVGRTSLERMSPFFTDHDALCCTVGHAIAQVLNSKSHSDFNFLFQPRSPWSTESELRTHQSNLICC